MIRFIKSKPTQVCLLLFLVINFVFFHPLIKGFVPLPLDHLVGALYPWHDYNAAWGYGAGVPIKNPSLSDIFSQIYPWRVLAVNLMKSGHLPLWNSFEFSGTPLMANLQSATFYPLIILMFVFGNLWGYSLMIFLQPLLSMVFMFIYLRELKISYQGAFMGAVLFAYSGLMLTYLEMATATQVFMWTPLLLFFIEKLFNVRKWWWLIPIPLVEFFCLTGGHFQTVFYQFFLIGCYILFLIKKHKIIKRWNLLLVVGITFILGALLAAFQIIPTIELLNISIRASDANIRQYNFGLLPIWNLITFLIPDFFGNPASYNFWGFLGYQEATFYLGVIPFALLLGSLFFVNDEKTRALRRFFIWVFLICCLLIFRTPFGYAVYLFNIPVLSTSYATRLILILDFSAIMLLVLGFEKVQEKQREFIKLSYWLLGFLATIVIMLLGAILIIKTFGLKSQLPDNFAVSLKNMILPGFSLVVFVALLKFVNNKKLLTFLVVAFTVFDILRLGIKFTPFSESRFDFPVVPPISYLQQNIGNFRMERERTEVMPPDTWVAYGLQSPSGYDPLYSKNYSNFYSIYNNSSPDDTSSSRYNELKNYYTPFIDLLGVKYLMTVKRDAIAVIDKTASAPAGWFQQPRFKNVFTDLSTVILQNKDVMPRVNLFDKIKVESSQKEALVDLSNGLDFKSILTLDSAPPTKLTKSFTDASIISSYQSDKVIIQVVNQKPTMLMLTDEYYPGWKATVNGKESRIYLADGAFRAVYLPAGKSTVIFSYLPSSFTIGLKIALIALGSLVAFFVIVSYKRRFLFD
jgi:hypothetical protein